MTLELGLNEMLQQLLNRAHGAITAKQLVGCIDLTLLEESATAEQLNKLKTQATNNPVAAICVLSEHLHEFVLPNTMPLATVVNFPHGTNLLNQSLKQINEAKQLGATEIDYVLPYLDYLNGFEKQVIAGCSSIAKECESNELTLKIIIETGAFPDIHKVYQVSEELINLGCDFLKTSTGKITQGASLSAVFAMLRAIKDSNTPCGVKVSGGVKTYQQALGFAQLAELVLEKPISSDWFRIGASSLLDELSKM